MNYYKKIVFVPLLCCLLVSCVAAPKTSLPSLTFGQYASAPMYFGRVSYSPRLPLTFNNDLESKLRKNIESYAQSRFVPDGSHDGALILSPIRASVEQKYLREGGKYDLLSAWKSYDQYIFTTEISLEMVCVGGMKTVNQTVTISRDTKIPGSYSPYKRDLHFLKIMEIYISEIDQALINVLEKMCV